jgi:hypothetical protein
MPDPFENTQCTYKRSSNKSIFYVMPLASHKSPPKKIWWAQKKIFGDTAAVIFFFFFFLKPIPLSLVGKCSTEWKSEAAWLM